MTEIHGAEIGHRHWAEVGRAEEARPDRGPGTGGPPNTQTEAAAFEPSGFGALQAEILETLSKIEVPPKEEVARSVEWVSDRISDEAGAGLAAQANLQPARTLALVSG